MRNGFPDHFCNRGIGPGNSTEGVVMDVTEASIFAEYMIDRLNSIGMSANDNSDDGNLYMAIAHLETVATALGYTVTKIEDEGE